MTITYNDTIKDLPLDQLHHLFVAVGWSDNEHLPVNMKMEFMKSWQNSTVKRFKTKLQRHVTSPVVMPSVLFVVVAGFYNPRLFFNYVR